MPYILKKYYPARNLIFFFGEGLLIFFVLAGVYLADANLIVTDKAELAIICLRAGVVTLIFQICLYYFDLYDLADIPSFADSATRITQAFGIGCIVLALIYYLFPAVIISIRVFWISYAGICLVIACWRFAYTIVLDRRLFTQPILLLGTGITARGIADEILSHKDSGYKISAFVGDEAPELAAYNIPLHGDSKTLLSACRDYKAAKIIVALDDQRGKLPIKELLACKLQGTPIETGVSFFETLSGKILVQRVNPSWLIYSDGFKKSRFITVGKRVLDLTASTIGLVISLPVFLISALIIKLESPGPVFYQQERVGEKGKIFKVTKFRSMTCDAEKDGPVWASRNDCRTTRYGAFIRKARIDEIPQMLNVLKGDMSFVGPRPERPVFVEQLEQKIPYYSLRHSVKPGITGWAQVCYPYGASEEDALRKLEYDLYYIKNLTLAFDFWVIFQTIKTVLFQKGSR